MGADDFAIEALKVERLLIGSILLDAGKCSDAFEICQPSDFIDENCSGLFRVVAVLYSQGEPVSDIGWLSSALVGNKSFKGLGGVAGVSELLSEAVTPAHGLHYANEVRRHSQRRSIISAGQRLIEAAMQSTFDPVEVASNSVKDLMATIESQDTSRFCAAGDCYAAAVERMYALIRGEKDTGIPTGIRCLDTWVGTLQPSELIILAARPNVGKTAFAFDLLTNAAKSGTKSLFVSCEMNRTQLGQRMISRDTGISVHHIDNGIVSDQEKAAIANARDAIRGLPITIWEASAPTIAQIASHCRSHSARHGLDLICIDHIGLLSASNRNANRYQQMTEIAKDLKTLATSLEKPVLALCQLNREGEGETPKLSMLRDSGAIEENADKVWMLHRERDKQEAELYVAKFRQGRVGKTQDGSLIFDGNRCSYRDANEMFTGDFG
jgi:replicative DNA helicase